MTPWLSIVGLSEGGLADLTPAACALVADAEVLVGGKRHLALAAALITGETVAWPTPMKGALPRILDLRGQPVVVLASGDPLHYGIGARLVERVEARDPEPEALLTRVPRLAGLDGDGKMSKSRNNTIPLGAPSSLGRVRWSGVKLHAGTVLLVPGMSEDHFDQLAAAEAKFAKFIFYPLEDDREEALRYVGWCHDRGILVKVHTGGVSRSGAIRLPFMRSTAWKSMARVRRSGPGTSRLAFGPTSRGRLASKATPSSLRPTTREQT